jgi:hypothetical protein
MNIHAKIFNETNLATFNIIYHDQVGFIPGMLGWSHIQKSTNKIYHINIVKKNHDYHNRCRKNLQKYNTLP